MEIAQAQDERVSCLRDPQNGLRGDAARQRGLETVYGGAPADDDCVGLLDTEEGE